MKTRAFVLSLLVLITLVCNPLFAQDYVFKVLANKGENQVKKAGTSQATALKTGSTLQKGDEIIAGAGAYIGLMHSSGKTTEVNKPGAVKVDELASKISTGSSSVASRYASYVASKMNEGDGPANYRNNMTATGAVQRAAGASAINVKLPNSVDFYGDQAIVSWETAAENAVYVVSIKNIFDEEVLKEETNNTFYEIDFTNSKLAQERLVILNVQVKGDDKLKSSDYGIKRLSSADAAKIDANLNSLKSEINEDSPLNKIIYASFFEENNLILDALTKYEEALQMSPDVQEFQEIYNSFLAKNGLAN